MRRELEHVEIPGENEARERAWRVVSTAFAEREPLPAPARRRLVPSLALVAVAAIAAATVTSPGRALLHGIRETVGVEKAQPALFSLPAPGRLLVQSDAGSWVVATDGSQRLLGLYREASWSPYGLFVVAARRNELAALEPNGDMRWKLARRDVRLPRWGGTRDDTRIAYLSGRTLRVVGGDGRGDRLLAPHVAPVAPAWLPTTKAHILAYVEPSGAVRVVDADSGRTLSRSDAARPTRIAWTFDGRFLIALRDDSVAVLPAGDEASAAFPLRRGSHSLVVAPRSQRFVLTRRTTRGQTEVTLFDARRARPTRRVFVGDGALSDLAWSPDERWLLVSWASADQWVFVRTTGAQRIRAVANVSAQFRSQAFPRVEGWCCAR